MSAMEQLGEAERERMFCDWGEPVIVRTVTIAASPSTGLVTETKRDVYATAIVRERVAKPTTGTALRHSARELEFVLRAAELPTEMRIATSRLVHRQIEYALVSTTESANGALVVIQAQKV